MKICCVCGARPNFIKIGAIVQGMAAYSQLQPMIVHTGQHYDAKLSRVMFEELGLPTPDVNLEVGSASQALQTARIMQRFEPVVMEERPDLVLVVGDVNSTVACGLVAVKVGIPLAHVEAGLRSFDRDMPEEINRIVTDALSDLLFVSEASGVVNLRREGVPDDNVFFVGNVMIDTLLAHRQKAASSDVLDRLGLEEKSYAVVTLHRPSNVDDPATLNGCLKALWQIGKRLPVVFPVHPRTRKRLQEFGLLEGFVAPSRTSGVGGIHLIEPQGYLDFLRLTGSARLILTDSGGIQEEATILEVPCLTLRDNTERPATIESGWNRLVGSDPERVLTVALELLDRPADDRVGAGPPELWDGDSALRIAEVFAELGTEGLDRLRRGRSDGSRRE